MRMLMNNLDPDVAENPDQLVVYGVTGRAARSWEAYDAIEKGMVDIERALMPPIPDKDRVSTLVSAVMSTTTRMRDHMRARRRKAPAART